MYMTVHKIDCGLTIFSIRHPKNLYFFCPKIRTITRDYSWQKYIRDIFSSSSFLRIAHYGIHVHCIIELSTSSIISCHIYSPERRKWKESRCSEKWQNPNKLPPKKYHLSVAAQACNMCLCCTQRIAEQEYFFMDGLHIDLEEWWKAKRIPSTFFSLIISTTYLCRILWILM